MKLSVECRVEITPRVLQVQGLFDLSPEKSSRTEWNLEVPDLASFPWHIGLITGPSGCGKSTLARHLFRSQAVAWADQLGDWSPSQSILDGFPDTLSVRDITALLGAVGFSSPPAWLRPYHALSTGQQFRVTLARLLASARPEQVAVFDEYTSVVDRTVAKIGSAAVAKAVRKRGTKFVAVTCHEDVADWLQPDWTLHPATGEFTRRSLQRRRPPIRLEVSRCSSAIWPLFAPHHYLSGELNGAATHFLATWNRRPVAFSSWLPFFGAGAKARREHRTVVLPDFQGVGIGMALSNLIASMWVALGYVARSTTTHPAFKLARNDSPLWQLVRSPSFTGQSASRLTTGWQYIGPPLDRTAARKLLAD